MQTYFKIFVSLHWRTTVSTFVCGISHLADKLLISYTEGHKTKLLSFCDNFVKYPPISMSLQCSGYREFTTGTEYVK